KRTSRLTGPLFQFGISRVAWERTPRGSGQMSSLLIFPVLSSKGRWTSTVIGWIYNRPRTRTKACCCMDPQAADTSASLFSERSNMDIRIVATQVVESLRNGIPPQRGVDLYSVGNE